MWVTFVLILVFLGLSVVELGPMYATNRRQTDRQTDRQTSDRQTSDQTKASLNASALLGKGIKKRRVFEV